jgi:SAM-dependent methyltransferase
VTSDDDTAVRSKSFGAVADEYDRLRPVLNDDTLDWVLPPHAVDVLEIAAGTGIATRRLASRVPHLTAVEPDDRMRAVLAGRSPEVRALAGRAEELPVDDDAFDAVVIATAWHWVDQARALLEVARVLRPGGRLSIFWCGPDRSVAFMRNLRSGRPANDPDNAAEIETHWRHHHRVDAGTLTPELFTPGEQAQFRWTQPMDREDLIAMMGTFSRMIVLDDTERHQLFADMRRYLDEHEDYRDRDIIDVPMRSECWRATAR